ncbi:hypothetical protein FGO68_gene4798 [Halteria grandinella]|uniref:Uncharacterized protein n=1 Tax=Halteria grandinella TaxID=5974 RepID=A0A8J8T611_HALGN|nr:hypothetical protein FGO68_gene4798 [Halteria grandinella]
MGQIIGKLGLTLCTLNDRISNPNKIPNHYSQAIKKLIRVLQEDNEDVGTIRIQIRDALYFLPTKQALKEQLQPTQSDRQLLTLRERLFSPRIPVQIHEATLYQDFTNSHIEHLPNNCISSPLSSLKVQECQIKTTALTNDNSTDIRTSTDSFQAQQTPLKVYQRTLGKLLKNLIIRNRQEQILNYCFKQSDYSTGLNWVLKCPSESTLFTGGSFNRLYLIRLGYRYSSGRTKIMTPAPYFNPSHQKISEFNTFCGALNGQDSILVGSTNSVMKFDTHFGKFQRSIATRDTVLKIYSIDIEHALLCERNGYIEIVNVTQGRRIQSLQINAEKDFSLHDLARLSNNKYVVAGCNGLYIIILGFKMSIQLDKVMFREKQISCLEKIDEGQVLTCFHNQSAFGIIDISLETVTEVQNPYENDGNTHYTCIKALRTKDKSFQALPKISSYNLSTNSFTSTMYSPRSPYNMDHQLDQQETLFIAKSVKALYLINLNRDRDKVMKIMEFSQTQYWQGLTDSLQVELDQEELRIILLLSREGQGVSSGHRVIEIAIPLVKEEAIVLKHFKPEIKHVTLPKSIRFNSTGRTNIRQSIEAMIRTQRRQLF